MLSINIQISSSFEQYFTVALFIIPYKVVITFESVTEPEYALIMLSI